MSISRNIIRKLINRDVDFADSHNRFRFLYLMRDPYALSHEGERYRLAATNEFIEKHVPNVNTLFEFGCGEGHQTREFAKIASRIVGMDISATAVNRARRRCPEASFVVGDITKIDIAALGAPFDLATACEVMYYMSKPDECMKKFDDIAEFVFISYFNHPKYARQLDPLIEKRDLLSVDLIKWRDTEWKVAIWKGQATSRRRV